MNVMFLGQMGSGKSFYANILVDKGFERISLATPIKEMEMGLDDAEGSAEFAELIYPHFKYVPEYGGDSRSAMISVLRKAKNIEREEPKPRKRLQYIGTEGGREKVDWNIWIKILLGKVKKDDFTDWVLDDCRFMNEFKWLSKTFTPIKVLIDEKTQMERLTRDYPGFDPKVLEHASEQDVKNMHPKLTIDGTLSRDEAKKQLEEMLKPYDQFIS